MKYFVVIAISIIWLGVFAFYFILKKYSSKEELSNWKYIPILNFVASDWGVVKKHWKKFILIWFIVLILFLWWSLSKGI